MKKIKCLLLIISLFALCGCSATYTLVIKADISYDETVDLYDQESNLEYKEIFENALDNKVEAYYSDRPIGDYDTRKSNIEHYKISPYNANGNYGVSYYYKFPTDKYNDSNALKFCTDNFNISRSDNVVKIQVSSFKCFKNYPELDSLRVNINVDRDVMYSNEDTIINNDTYVWIINQLNYNTKNITLYYKIDNNKNIAGETQKVKEEDPEIEEPEIEEPVVIEPEVKEPTDFDKAQDFASKHKVLIIVGAFLGFGLLIFIFIKIKKIKL